MSQTAVIFASLFVAFLVYVTLRGQLPAYAAVFFGKAPPDAPLSANAQSAVNAVGAAGSGTVGGAGGTSSGFGQLLF